MPRTAQGRHLRSTQTSPNAGAVRDLTAGAGAAGNTTTTAAFPAAGASGFRWNPNTTATAANPPTAGTAATGNQWRDAVAEHAAESVSYDAGTWTLQARLNKTVMTVNATVTVRVTMIAYQVTSAGTFVAEIGRATLPDTALPTVNSAVFASASFSGAQTTFDAGDKIAIEAYVQNIVAGAPATAAAAYTVALVVDASANDSAITAMPGYQILYARSQSTTAIGTAAMARTITAARSFATTAIATSANIKQVAPLPKATAAVGTVTLTKRTSPLPKTTTAIVTVSNIKRTTPLPKTVTAIGTAAAARTISAGRVFATTAIATTGFGRAVILGRAVSTTATAIPRTRLDIPEEALDRIIPAAAPDWPLNAPTKTIAGVTRNSAGAVVGSATVKLVRQSDDVRVATTTSHVTTGAYSFTRGFDDPNTYRVVATKAGTPEIHGVSDELVPV